MFLCWLKQILHGYYDAGFDAVYSWPEFNVMKNIAAGKRMHLHWIVY